MKCAAFGAVICVLLWIGVNANEGIYTRGYKTGKLGVNITYRLNEDDGFMNIYGTGKMTDSYVGPFKEFNKMIKRAVIAEGIETVGAYLFSNTSVEEVTIPEGITSIGNNAFYLCKSLKKVFIPSSVVSLGESVFYRSSVDKIVVHDNNPAFVSIDGVLFDKNVTTLFAYPPGNKRSTYIIPDTVVTLEKQSFGECHYLDHIDFPDSVTTIGAFAFWNCTGLTYVTFGKNVDTMGQNVFLFCSHIAFAYFKGNPSSIHDLVFQGCSSLSGVCVTSNYTGASIISRKPVDSTSKSCTEYESMFNQCFEEVYNSNYPYEQKRPNATKWEELTNDCGVFTCVNETGPSVVMCNGASSQMCVNDNCTDPTELWRTKASVLVQIKDNVKANTMNTSEVFVFLQTECNMSTEGTHVGYDLDSQGNVVRVVIFVDDKATAQSIADKIKSMDYYTCDYGILCPYESVSVYGPGEFVSGASSIHSMMKSVFVALLVAAFSLIF